MARDPHGKYTPPAPGTLDRQFVTDGIPGTQPANELEALRAFETQVRSALADDADFGPRMRVRIASGLANLDRKRGL